MLGWFSADHWGFMAEDKKVDGFYKAAISAGARDNFSPRARLEYYPGYYAADVFDPDGYSFEVVHKIQSRYAVLGPQPNRQTAKSCRTCRYFHSPRVVISILYLPYA